MAREDYNPIPQVSPSAAPLPGVHPAVPEAAFGGLTAMAISRMGQAVEGAGNEIFARAIAMQQLDNESVARDADAKYMVEAGRLHAEYNSLEGKARVDAFPKYQKDLNDSRQKLRDSLPNVMAQRMYDSSSLSTMGRSIFNGAGAAASANKDYAVGTIKATADMDNKSIEDDPFNQATIDEKIRRAKINAGQIAMLQHGAAPDSQIAKDIEFQSTSRIIASQIKGALKTSPTAAQKLLVDNKSKMTTDDYNLIYDRVTSVDRAVGTANMANDVYNRMGIERGGQPAATLKEMEDEVRQKAEAYRPNDPIFQKDAVAAIQSRYYINRRAEQQDYLQTSQNVANLIKDQQPKTVQDFMALPDGSELYNQMKPSDRLKLPEQLKSYYESYNRDENFKEYRRLKGMADNPETVNDFLSEDLYKSKLNNGQLNSLLDLRDKLVKKPTGDPHVAQGMEWLRRDYGSTLQALGVYSRKDNIEEYDMLQGSISEAIGEWSKAHKAMPTYQDFKEKIAPQLLKDVQVPGRFFGTNTYHQFDIPVPAKDHELIVQAMKADGRPEPSEEEVRRLYLRKTFQNLFQQPKSQDKVNASP